MIDLFGIFRRLPEHRLLPHPFDLRDILSHIADKGAVAPGAADGFRGHVGAVRFQNDLLQRQGGDGFCGPLGPFEGARAAEAEVEPLLCQPERVVRAAGIAVDDALGWYFFSRA